MINVEELIAYLKAKVETARVLNDTVSKLTNDLYFAGCEDALTGVLKWVLQNKE